MNPPPPFLQASFPFSLLFYFSFPSLLFHPLRFPMFPPYLPLFFPVLSSFFILSFHFIFSLIIHHPYCLPYFLFFNCFFSPSVFRFLPFFLSFPYLLSFLCISFPTTLFPYVLPHPPSTLPQHWFRCCINIFIFLLSHYVTHLHFLFLGLFS